nr:MAG TPA: hypothetical protein [Caudoviricetes sp.]DAK33997.1 MAG TPA: hypothetical protein [Caudoviricetes sp.]DAN43277.1 MAG TPA: hypothetical protein [Caudoviricetes sp.]DAS74668.1 MAG TPA: hypothetical protein [Caudoviricetes sp.]DAX72292.1 MAG TPA: hypothetical protein [Caudoviricetes sp.]
MFIFHSLGTEIVKILTNIQVELGIRETRLTFLFSERTYFSIFQTFNFINIL